MDGVVAGKVSFSLKNAISINNSNNHRLLQTVKSLEAERDQNLLSLQIEKDEVVSSTWLAITKSKKESTFSEESCDGESVAQKEKVTWSGGSSRENVVRKTNSLPPLQKQAAVNKLDGGQRSTVNDRAFGTQNSTSSPPGCRRVSRLSSESQHKLPSPPASPKIQTRTMFGKNQHSKLVRSGRTSLNSSLLQSGRMRNVPFVELNSTIPTPSSFKASLTKQRSLQTPLNLSGECHLDLAHQSHNAEKLECKQVLNSPKLKRPKTATSATFTRHRTLSTNIVPRPLSSSFPEPRTSTAWSNETAVSTNQSSSTHVHRGLALRPIYSQKEKEQTKQKSSETVFTRLYKTGTKQNSRKHRTGEGLDRLAHGAQETAPPRSVTRLEERRRSLSMPDLTEMLDNLKSCRYLRKDGSHENLTDLS